MNTAPSKPVPSSAPAPAVRPASSLKLPERPRTILVAEDEHLVAAYLTSQLSELGHTVLLATNGEEAVALARSGSPDLGLFDIKMPQLDGIAAAQRVFTESLVPVVILSAYSDAPQIAAAQDAGVFAYLVKPATADQLRATVGIAWSAFRRHVEQQANAESLQKRLDERKIIEQAKWILVSTKGMTEPDAAHHLNRTARSARRATVDVAREIVAAQPPQR
jgi:response regulator NasT